MEPLEIKEESAAVVEESKDASFLIALSEIYMYPTEVAEEGEWVCIPRRLKVLRHGIHEKQL
ncbi:hypothetical protein T11_13572 [Trichinella zimbabwensis]|uniref:Uncharacterized protein n=1 Tax=Trichinella zimbabwensis TaxID=268475 RepID=A0A0V1I781_9BILA|nr:hypothetical protein T11_13572 [Trichinella zimbabwensis]